MSHQGAPYTQEAQLYREDTSDFFNTAVIDALTAHIVVLDERGTIIMANKAWKRFAEENNSTDPNFYIGTNYATVCEIAVQQAHDPIAAAVLQGIHAVLRGEQQLVTVEYPCHSATQERWFIMRITRLQRSSSPMIVIAHNDITERKRLENQLSHQAQLLAIVNDVIIGTDENFIISFWNAAAAAIFGWSPEEVIGRPAAEVLRTSFSETDRIESIRKLAEDGYWRGEVTQYARDGTPKIVEANIMALHNQDGKVIGFLSANRDITERKRAEIALQESETRFRTLTEKLPDAVYTLNLNTQQMTYFNHDTFLGYTRDELIGPTSILAALHPDDAELVFAHWQRACAGDTETSIEYRLRNKAGQWEWIKSRTTVVSRNEDDTPKELMVILTVITNRKLAQAALEEAKASSDAANRELQEAFEREQEMARTDMLTQARNRRYFFEIATYELALAQRQQRPMAIMLFDIDHFKVINDTYGHQIGDQVLRIVADKAREYVRQTDLFARYGGEEFVMLLPGSSAAEALIAAERIREGIAACELNDQGHQIRVTVSIGIAEVTAQDEALDRVIQRADKALYAAKLAGRNRSLIFSPPPE